MSPLQRLQINFITTQAMLDLQVTSLCIVCEYLS